MKDDNNDLQRNVTKMGISRHAMCLNQFSPPLAAHLLGMKFRRHSTIPFRDVAV